MAEHEEAPIIREVLADLAAEEERLETILEALTPEQWAMVSGAPGWTITNVMVHLAQTEEAVVATLAAPGDSWAHRDGPLDAAIDAQVLADRAAPAEVFDRWRQARRAALTALASADPAVRVRWAAAPLRPTTLATTRLAEHWAHALDVAEPLGIDLADTDRLRHIARLGHATLPYALRLAGHVPVDVEVTLAAPSGTVWSFGPPGAASAIAGSAGEFCRVGARRLTPERSALVATGPHGAVALQVLRNYAA